MEIVVNATMATIAHLRRTMAAITGDGPASGGVAAPAPAAPSEAHSRSGSIARGEQARHPLTIAPSLPSLELPPAGRPVPQLLSAGGPSHRRNLGRCQRDARRTPPLPASWSRATPSRSRSSGVTGAGRAPVGREAGTWCVVGGTTLVLDAGPGTFATLQTLVDPSEVDARGDHPSPPRPLDRPVRHGHPRPAQRPAVADPRLRPGAGGRDGRTRRDADARVAARDPWRPGRHRRGIVRLPPDRPRGGDAGRADRRGRSGPGLLCRLGTGVVAGRARLRSGPGPVRGHLHRRARGNGRAHERPPGRGSRPGGRRPGAW